MKKRTLLLALMSLLLTGCSSIDEFAGQKMLEKSGIENEESYKEYERAERERKVTPDGYNSDAVFMIEDAETAIPAGSAHITFGENRCLSAAYFTDAAQKEAINTQRCYLTAGSRIYAAVSVKKSAPSSAYVFEEVRIYRCNADGSRELISAAMPDADGLIFEVGSEYAGAELAIEPIGRYKTEAITLNDYRDSDGSKVELSGEWTVNNTTTKENSVEISAVSSAYYVSYSYDSNKYFFVSSDPTYFYLDNDDGVVTFKKREATDSTDSYSVELQEYINVSVPLIQDLTAQINGGEMNAYKKGDNLLIQKLKYGSEVTVITDRECGELKNCRELIILSDEPQGSGYKYTMVLPHKGGEFAFDPSEYTYEHGTVTFMCYGEKVIGTQYLPKGATIMYESASADDDYWLGNGEKKIVVRDDEQTRAELNAIRFIPKIQTTVTLPQPKYGGSIDYYVDGSKIDSETYITTSGTKLTMEFHPWEGWICGYENGETYTVTEDKAQKVRFGDNNKDDVDSVFTEDEAHKPVLTVTLDKSLGESAQLIINAQGLAPESCYQYESKFLRGENAVLKKEKIGTGEDIAYSVKNRAIQSGTAIKVLVETTDSDNNKLSRYTLLDNTMAAQKQNRIALYKPEERAESEVWYKSVGITVSVVDAHEFTEPAPMKNASISVRSDNFGQLRTGDILDDSAKVTLSIKPDKGYYVAGKGVKNDAYQTTMSFADYREKIQKIMDSHSIEPYYLLRLEEEDSFGSCVYELDGKKVSGSVYAKEGQKLTIEYKLTEDGFSIDGAKTGVVGFMKSDRKITKSVTVTAELDGAVMNRESFGITVVKVGDK